VDKSIDVDNSIDELLKALDGRKGPNDSFDEVKYDLLKKLSEALRIKYGNDARAISLFDRAVYENNKALNDKEENGNAVAYNRLGADFYLMGKFETAVEAHDKAIRIDKTYLASKIYRGYAQFALAEFAGAADDFGDALKLPRDQTNTMMWLYLSQERSRQKGHDHPNLSAELRNKARKLGESNCKNWPLPIIELFSGTENWSPEKVLECVNSAKNGDPCQAHFHVGEWFVLHKPADADKYLQKAEKICPFDSVERLAAREELKRLGPGQEVAAMGASPGISRVPRRSRR
jgi:tetratricopeptide (TPR) repeat protein